MKRLATFLFAVFIVCIPLWSMDSIILNNNRYSVDTLSHFMAGPGSYYTSLELIGNSKLHVYFLTIDANNPNIQIKSALGRDSILLGERPSSMAQRKSTDGSIYFGGTNGDFYITTGDVGLPTGGTLVDEQLAFTPNNNRKVIGFNDQNQALLGKMTFNGTCSHHTDTFTINHVNYNRGTNEIVLYNQFQGKSTKTNTYGNEIEVTLLPQNSWRVDSAIQLVVTSKNINRGNSQILPGKAILSGHGVGATTIAKLNLGDTVTLNLHTTIDNIRTRFQAIVGGDPRELMLHNGIIEKNDIWDELHPRTALGSSIHGDSIIFCVVDGRGTSVGCTTYVLAELMKSAGAYNAINLDGGGSSCLYLREFGPMNRVSDGTERAVCNGIFAVANVPIDNTIAKIKSLKSHYIIPQYGIVSPTFLGYSTYDILIEKDVKGVTLSCDSIYGYINPDGCFVASKGRNGFITATYGNNITTTIPFTIDNSATIYIKLDSVLIDNDTEYPIEVICLQNNKPIQIEPQALTWQILDPSICSIHQGTLRGLKSGKTEVIGNYGTYCDTLIVHVQYPTTGVMTWEKFDSTTINRWQLQASSSNWNSQLLQSNATLPASIKFKYTTARDPNITLKSAQQIYSTPDSIQFRFNANNVALSKVVIALRANHTEKSTSLTFTDIVSDGITTLTIHPESFVTSESTQEIFPLFTDFISFYLDASKIANNSACQIDLYDIRLFFGNITVESSLENVTQGIVIYPNPTAQGTLYVTSPDERPLQYRIFTVDGKLISTKELEPLDSETTQINVAGLPTGQYILMLTFKDKTVSSKIIINN